MASLSQKDTRELGTAHTQVKAVIERMQKGPLTPEDQQNMVTVLKEAADRVRTVWIMKGEYPK